MKRLTRENRKAQTDKPSQPLKEHMVLRIYRQERTDDEFSSGTIVIDRFHCHAIKI